MRSIPLYLSALAATCLVAPALGVDIDVPGDAPTIQAAIEAASDGDRVLVSPGTYYEAINFNGKAITVQATGGAAWTTIDAEGLETSVVTCDTGEFLDSVLDGFTITNGRGTPLGGDPHGGGVYARFTSPTIRNCVFENNHAGAGGGVYVRGSVSEIMGCVFRSNTSTEGGLLGGGGVFVHSGSVRIENCVFDSNESITGSKGGGVNLALTIDAKIVNCLFVNNTATHGGGVMNQEGTATITNCTFVGNHATNSGGALRGLGLETYTYLNNSIVWDNTAVAEGTDEVLEQGGAVTYVRFSDVKGGWNGSGEGNIDAVPAFADQDGLNFRLQNDSPCVDTSDNGALPRETTIDLDGNSRISNGTVDMGAYESQVAQSACAEDLDGDGMIDFGDLLSVLSNWGPCPGCPQDLDGDGDVEFHDLLIVLAHFGPCS